MKEWCVLDENGNVSYGAKTEEPETFGTFASAKRRAESLAALAPGQTIRIAEIVAETCVATKPVETVRKYPQERYQ